ncbi:nucleotidyltransferase family protein [Phreatobacter cathodiphilus]|uniref:Mannose-1-phosphate guanylyltransferase n=1 Tax=Phreatobacter cathodiphilus TaxID=1868589 RepID=A0A2S0NHY7_9HYPH|nr:nucleotidyltransferase family protein [Phreatobacter cathodiphilus]AVO47764.1 mannose-1-phosphate guanylyltransferase [Phreatobacter cathodiphilus]
MVLAAGLGTRMRPITDRIPKPLVRVGSKTLLDHVLDPLAEAGVTRAVVNVHHLADQIEAAVAGRERPEVVISDERAQILDSGGGVARALPHLGETFLIRNADSFWTDRGPSNLVRMIEAFDPDRMDTLLLLAPMEGSVGFDGPGDFFLDADGRLTRRGSAARAPYAYAGAAIMRKADFAGRADGEIFSLNALWNASLAKGRLRGLVLDGLWLHVGTPDAIGEAERALKG